MAALLVNGLEALGEANNLEERLNSLSPEELEALDLWSLLNEYSPSGLD
ncbi:MAG: hypothetical protein Kow0025_19610 [Thermodesulfovibrionales bacterium]